MNKDNTESVSMEEIDEFDRKAAEWDKNYLNQERAQFVATQIRTNITLHKGMKAMEFGAGTGILSFMLKEDLGSIILVDTSAEMLRIADQKIREAEANTMHTLKANLEHDRIEGGYDLIFSQMAFHHVENIPLVTLQLFGLLNPGGHLVIADIYPEDGSFHGEGFTGHKGFDPQNLGLQIRKAGFRDVAAIPSYVQRRMNDDGSVSDYPLFLLTASKN